MRTEAPFRVDLKCRPSLQLLMLMMQWRSLLEMGSSHFLFISSIGVLIFSGGWRDWGRRGQGPSPKRQMRFWDFENAAFSAKRLHVCCNEKTIIRLYESGLQVRDISARFSWCHVSTWAQLFLVLFFWWNDLPTEFRGGARRIPTGGWCFRRGG